MNTGVRIDVRLRVLGAQSIRVCRVLAVLMLLAVEGTWAQEAFVMHALEASRFVVATGGYFPRMEVLKNGDLLVAVKSGAAHVGKSGRADVVRSRDGGMTWSNPVTVFDLPGRDDAIDLLGRLSDGTVIAAAVSYTWAGDTYSGEGWEADTYVLRSEDQGETWSKPRKLETTPFDWLYPFGRPVELGDGSVLLAGYGAYVDRAAKEKVDARGHTSFVVRSRDGGKTWGGYAEVARHFNEICLARLPSGKLLGALRGDAGSTFLSFSKDDGRIWSKPDQLTGRGEHPADLLVLSDGNLLMSYGVRHEPYGVQAKLSRDEGGSWNERRRSF